MDKQAIAVNGRVQNGAFIRPKNGIAKKASRQWEYKTIDKEEAKSLLAKMDAQRRLEAGRVAGYRRTMDAGLWDCAGGRGPIAVDYNGMTLNGQHRLVAFLGSKLNTITFLFVTGCDPQDIKSFDTDTKMRGVKWSHPGMTFPTRDLSRITAYDRLTTGDLSMRNTHVMMEHLRDRIEKECDWAAELMPNASGQGRAPYMAALMYVRRAAPRFADDVAKAWVNGGHGLPQTLLRLRDEALRGGARGGPTAVKEGVRLSLKMLNALALMHQEKAQSPRLTDSLSGLRYFSEISKDGAIKRWESGQHLTPEA